MLVQYVDGYKIRQELDVDFNVIHFRHTNPAYFISKWYIPKGEIWLDHKFRSEEEFLIEMETTPMQDFSRRAYIDRFIRPGKPKNLVSHEDKQPNGLTVQYIDGSQVRRFIDPQFVMGGHDLVYDYVPRQTIWIEQVLDEHEWPHILKHEAYERSLMEQGKAYDIAHDYACAAEKESRRAVGGSYIGDEDHTRQIDFSSFYVQP
jgi:hypothetical protein